MKISSRAQTSTFPKSEGTKPGDLLRTDMLRGPLVVRLLANDTPFELEFVDVATGAARITVGGLPQNCHFSDFSEIEDWDGNKFDPEDFYNETKG